jgi:two-component system, LytTR family, sensor histidine kinase AlgZ
MHPVLSNRRRLALYLLTWLLLAVLLALLVIEPGRRGIPPAVLLTLPPALAYAFVCLAAWYPVRAMPLERTNAWRLMVSHAFAAMVLASIWLLLFRVSAHLSSFVEGGETAIANRSPALFVAGALLYLLAVAFHYLLAGLERAARVETLAREAELKVLKSQLDPHFLFNSLNSISSLCGSNPATARTLTTLLAEYLRKSLRTGTAESITLSEELELASSYLAIERIRFGPRLELAQEIDENVRGFRVPPLLLQPLVENAVKHGIAQLIEGGTLQIAAARDGGHVRISVDNRCDPDRVAQHGEGIGLENTRRRVETFYGPAARVEVMEEPSRFRVALVLPA